MHFVRINGVTIHYRYLPCSSPGRENEVRKTFVFINSLGTDFRIWDDLLEQLNDYGNLLLYDKRGHGLSDMVDHTGSLQNYTEDLMGLLEYLSIKQCILVGLSVGGMIAQLLVYNKPEMVEKLVLCDTGYKIGTEQGWNDRIHKVMELGLSGISKAVVQRWFSDSFYRENFACVAGCCNMLERTTVAGYIQACAAIRDTDLELITKGIMVPVLCIVGSEDKSTTPEEVKRLAELIEGSSYKVIKDSGHIPCIDNPTVLGELIIDFIK